MYIYFISSISQNPSEYLKMCSSWFTSEFISCIIPGFVFNLTYVYSTDNKFLKSKLK